MTHMDFYPSLLSFIVVGCADCEPSFWDVGLKLFTFWTTYVCSVNSCCNLQLQCSQLFNVHRLNGYEATHLRHSSENVVLRGR